MEGEVQQENKKRITDAPQIHIPRGGKVGGASRHPQTSYEGTKGASMGKGKTTKINKDLRAIPKNQTQTQLDAFLEFLDFRL